MPVLVPKTGSDWSIGVTGDLSSGFSDQLQETHCLILGSITGDYCLFLAFLYSYNFSLISYFKTIFGSNKNLLKY